MKINNLLYILITNCLITFSAGHAMLPLLFLEPILFARLVNLNLIEIGSALFLLLGQILILIAYKNDNYKLGVSGILILSISAFMVYFSLPEKSILTFYSSIPFVVLSIFYILSRLFKL